MSPGQWFRRQRLLTALSMLGSGQTVDETATALGYSSARAFIAMFRKKLGQPPVRYLSAIDHP